MKEKKIVFHDKNNYKKYLKEFGIFCGYSRRKADVYKINDDQVKSGNETAGSCKKRFGIILQIIDSENIIVAFATSKGNLVIEDFLSQKKIYFHKRFIEKINPQKDILFKSNLTFDYVELYKLATTLIGCPKFKYLQSVTTDAAIKPMHAV